MRSPGAERACTCDYIDMLSNTMQITVHVCRTTHVSDGGLMRSPGAERACANILISNTVQIASMITCLTHASCNLCDKLRGRAHMGAHTRNAAGWGRTIGKCGISHPQKYFEPSGTPHTFGTAPSYFHTFHHPIHTGSYLGHAGQGHRALVQVGRARQPRLCGRRNRDQKPTETAYATSRCTAL